MSSPYAWLGRTIVVGGGGYLYRRWRSYRKREEAFDALKSLLATATRRLPSQCQPGIVSRMCPVSGFALTNHYNKHAGGTDTLHMYDVIQLDGERFHIQFYDLTRRVWIWEFDANLRGLDIGRELDPVAALEEIVRESGLGREPVSPH